MQATRKAILNMVTLTLQELGEDLDIPELLAANESTRLFGARSPLDSMNLVNLIAEIEDRLSDDFDLSITLASERAMSRVHSPFRSVGSCVDYIMELIETAEPTPEDE